MGSTTSVLGTWKLEAFEIEAPDGTRQAWGRNAHGLLIYAPSGCMSVAINKDVVKESENEFEDLFDSILFYAGTFVIDGPQIRHQVTEASNPSRIGREMIRYATFEGDRVILSTPVEAFGKAILTWRRVSP